jgi:hypothetical protein
MKNKQDLISYREENEYIKKHLKLNPKNLTLGDVLEIRSTISYSLYAFNIVFKKFIKSIFTFK